MTSAIQVVTYPTIIKEENAICTLQALHFDHPAMMSFYIVHSSRLTRRPLRGPNLLHMTCRRGMQGQAYICRWDVNIGD